MRGESGPKVVAKLTTRAIETAHGPLKGMDPTAGQRAAQRFSAIPSASAGSNYGSLTLAAGSDKIIKGLGVVRQYVEDLMTSLAQPAP